MAAMAGGVVVVSSRVSRMSSGTNSLFSFVAVCIAAAGGLAYGLQNQDQVRKVFVAVTGVPLAPDRQPESIAAAAIDDVAEGRSFGGDVTLRAGPHGHFETTAEINGRDVDVLVDTGATLVALSYDDAERAGIYLTPADFTHQTTTANGIAKVAPIMIGSISIGGITVRNIRGTVAERGKLSTTLLGMAFLSRLSRVEMQRGNLVLHE